MDSDDDLAPRADAQKSAPSPNMRTLRSDTAAASSSLAPLDPMDEELHRKLVANKVEQFDATYDGFVRSSQREKAAAALRDEYTLRRDVKSVWRRIETGNRWILNEKLLSVQLFELLMLLTLGFTVVVTPFEVGFMDEEDDTLLIANAIVNSIFAIGIVVEFFRPFREPVQVGGGLVKDHRRIAYNYLTTWFLFDVVCTVPWDLLREFSANGSSAESSADDAALGSSGQESDSALSNMRAVRMLRIMRLVKIGRLQFAARTLTRLLDSMERYVTISHAVRALTFWIGLVVLLTHWYCCAWGILAAFVGNDLRTAELEAVRSADGSCERGPGSCLSQCEMGLLASLENAPGFATEHVVGVIGRRENWKCRAKQSGYVPAEESDDGWATYSFLLGQQGNLGMSYTNLPAEMALKWFISFVQTIVTTLLLANVSSAYANSDPLGREFKTRMDHLNHFLKTMNFPYELKHRVRQHMRFTRDLVARKSYNDLLPFLSPRLKKDVLSSVSSATLRRAAEYFDECHDEGLDDFLSELSTKLVYMGFAQGEIVAHPEPTLSIVVRGTAVRGGKPIAIWKAWGKDFILTSPGMRDARHGAALTYIEIATLTRSALVASLERWPEAATVIRRAALKIAMGRAPLVLARYMRSKGMTGAKRAKLRRGSPKDGMPNALQRVDSPYRSSPTNHLDKQRMHKVIQEDMIDFNVALTQIGADTSIEHYEFHEVMRSLNGAPLRGFATEQQHSQDERVAALAKEQLRLAALQAATSNKDFDVIKKRIIVQEPDDGASEDDDWRQRFGASDNPQPPEPDAQGPSSAALLRAVKELDTKLGQLAGDVTAIKSALDSGALRRVPAAGRRRQRLESGAAATSTTRPLLHA